jgi:hypothetical protein
MFANLLLDAFALCSRFVVLGEAHIFKSALMKMFLRRFGHLEAGASLDSSGRTHFRGSLIFFFSSKTVCEQQRHFFFSSPASHASGQSTKDGGGIKF